jgi:hypothetical protein
MQGSRRSQFSPKFFEKPASPKLAVSHAGTRKSSLICENCAPSLASPCVAALVDWTWTIEAYFAKVHAVSLGASHYNAGMKLELLEQGITYNWLNLVRREVAYAHG